jgi:hypothetical protein
MSAGMEARIVPYSSIVGQSITLHVAGEPKVIAQLAVMAPAGPPPGESHQAYVQRLAKMIADAINRNS